MFPSDCQSVAFNGRPGGVLQTEFYKCSVAVKTYLSASPLDFGQLRLNTVILKPYFKAKLFLILLLNSILSAFISSGAPSATRLATLHSVFLFDYLQFSVKGNVCKCPQLLNTTCSRTLADSFQFCSMMFVDVWDKYQQVSLLFIKMSLTNSLFISVARQGQNKYYQVISTHLEESRPSGTIIGDILVPIAVHICICLYVYICIYLASIAQSSSSSKNDGLLLVAPQFSHSSPQKKGIVQLI